MPLFLEVAATTDSSGSLLELDATLVDVVTLAGDVIGCFSLKSGTFETSADTAGGESSMRRSSGTSAGNAASICPPHEASSFCDEGPFPTY